jgi:predicted lipid-binding transport protein (Tim44 family)
METGRSTSWNSLIPLSALRAFADGFGGGLVGGLMYCLVLAYFQPAELALAPLRVAALALTFGGFEVWRVTRKPTHRRLTTLALWAVPASLLLLWVVGSLVFSVESSSSKPLFNQVALTGIREAPRVLLVPKTMPFCI